MKRTITIAIAAAAVLALSPVAAPAGADTSQVRPAGLRSHTQEPLTSRNAPAAHYERMATIRLSGATGTLWRSIRPAGAWDWHANIHNAPPGSRVEARNWFENVVSSAVVPPGEIGANTGSWSSFGRFRVCIYVTGGRSGCSYFSPT